MTLNIGQTVQHKLTGKVGRVIGIQRIIWNPIYVVECEGDHRIIRATKNDFQLYTRMPR